MTWTADSGVVTADSGTYTADGFSPVVPPPFPPPVSTDIQPDGYNLYVNGVFNQFIVGLPRRIATIQGMNPGTTYQIKITILSAGVEAAESDQVVTIQPYSVKLTTDTVRKFPFPNTAPGG